MKKKIKKRIPAYAMGAKTDLGGMGDAVGGAVSLIGGIGGKSTATTQSEVVSQSLADVGKGAAAGAKIGSMFGPIGGAIGAVGGAAIGAIGKKGGIEQTEGFTEDNKYTLSTGFMALGNKKLKQRQAQDKLNVQGNRIAVQNTEELKSNWDEENSQETYTFADGGVMPFSLAYVDDGELIQTPDGSVGKIPEQGNPTDSNLINLPGGSKILSDKLKVPGTKKTFAEIGERMMAKKKNTNTDRFAENSKKLNDINNQIIHNQLFDIQEDLKLKKGIKSKTKAFANGGFTGKNLQTLSSDIIGTTPLKQMSTTIPMASFDYEKNVSRTNLQPRTVSVNAPGTAPSTGTSKRINFNTDQIGSIATDVMSLAPVMSNLFEKDTESVAPIQNPYSNIISSTMRKRRYDIEPAKQALAQNRAISDYNASQMNTNTGANMAYRLQSAVGLDKATSDLYSQASNIQNQYNADYANAMNNLGQQYVNAIGTARDINMRSRAAGRNIRRAGVSQLSDWAQNRQLMANQKRRDVAMMDVYRPFLEAGYTQEQVTDMFNKFIK